MSRRVGRLAVLVAAASLLGAAAASLPTQMQAGELLAAATARAAELEQPGSVVRTEWRTFVRHRPAQEQRPDPYHRRQGALLPETLRVVGWLEFGPDGRPVRSRAQAFGPDGGLVQDAVVTPEESTTYDALTDETEVGSGATLNSAPQPRDLVVPDPGQSAVRVVGMGQRGGQPTTVLEFPSQPVDPQDVRRQTSMAYAAPYVADLQPVGLKRQLEIRQSDRMPVLARVLVVSANGAATIASEQEIVATEHVAAAPAGVFSGAALPRTRVKTNAGPVASLPSMRTLTLAEVTTRLGRSPVQPDATSGFHLDQVMTAAQPQALSSAPASLRDLVFAAQRGDAVRLRYSDQRGRTLVVQEGDAVALRESARQSGATWAKSRQVQLSVGGKALVGWLLSFDPDLTPGTQQSGLIFESDGLLVDIRAFGVSDDMLLSAATTLE